MEEQEYKRIQKLISGDQREYQRIFDGMYESLCAFVHHFISDRSVCEDCVQEAFISFWNCRNGIKSMSHVRAFLYQTSRNNVLNYLKHERIKREYLSDKLSEIEDQSSWVDWVIEEEVERVLMQTRRELPLKCRDIFALAIQGKDNAEIARLLGVSENTVKTQKQLAYKRLKENIAEMFTLFLLLMEDFS